MFNRLLAGGGNVITTARKAPADIPAERFIQADVSTAEGVAKVAEEVFTRLGGIDILINNVGGSLTRPGGFNALSDTDWLQTLNENLLSAVRLDKSFLPSMLEQGKGVILHITSIQSRMPLHDATLAYAAAKAALANYSKGLSKEVAPKGVRVNRLSPGFIQTQSADRLVNEIAHSRGISFEEGLQELMNSLGGIPMGRPAKPEEVAELAAFIVSDRGGYLNGGEFTIDGGNIPTI